jgi:hypothetical protein
MVILGQFQILIHYSSAFEAQRIFVALHLVLSKSQKIAQFGKEMGKIWGCMGKRVQCLGMSE